MISAVSFAEEAPWVTVENVREHSGSVWREEIPRYNGAEEQGFQPLAMDPAEAWQRLRDAYDRGQDEATRELLQSWGIEMEPCGAPVLRELISQADLQHHGNSDISTENVPLVQVISFSGWGWGEEGTLIFVEQWPDWYLWDYIPFSCEDFRLCGTDDGTGVYLLTLYSDRSARGDHQSRPQVSCRERVGGQRRVLPGAAGAAGRAADPDQRRRAGRDPEAGCEDRGD